MPFPPFHAPWLGTGMVIGANATLHVVVSHGVAIGVIALLILGEVLRPTFPRAAATALGEMLHRTLRGATIAVTVVGAVTGAGIWFTTGALAPRGVASMLRVFFWPWFAEWVVFVAEVVVLLLLYLFWERMSRRTRIRLGVAYLLLALVSAFLITGILGFMLTPGGWTEDATLATAFFNPSFAPQLITRLALSMVLGALALLALLVVRSRPDGVEGPILRGLGVVLALSAPVLVVGIVAYVLIVPTVYTERTMFSVLTSHLSNLPWLFVGANAVALLLLGLVAAAAWAGRRRAVRWLVAPAVVAAVGFTVELERVREFIRGPYLMPEYMYANGLLVAEQPLLAAEGVVAVSPWARHPAYAGADGVGAYVFATACTTCHTVDGINAITRRVEGRSRDGLEVVLKHTHRMVSFMPPLPGTPRERRLTARLLYRLERGEAGLVREAAVVPAGER